MKGLMLSGMRELCSTDFRKRQELKMKKGYYVPIIRHSKINKIVQSLQGIFLIPEVSVLQDDVTGKQWKYLARTLTTHKAQE
jgi:hypothetical protein